MQKDIVKGILEVSKKEKELIGIWRYSDDSGFWTGYVLDFNEEFVELHHFTKYGKSDGIILERISDIESIDFRDDYCRALQYLIDHNEELDKEDIKQQALPKGNHWQRDFLKEHVGTKKVLLRISLDEDTTYSGFVDQIDDENVVMNMVGKLGEDEGFSMYKLKDIISVRVNDIENRKRQMLFNRRKSR